MEYDSETVIGEIKTAKQEVWDQRQAEMKPTTNHMLQLLTYMKLKNAKEGFFLYENKNTQELIVIPVSMNEKNKEYIIARVRANQRRVQELQQLEKLHELKEQGLITFKKMTLKDNHELLNNLEILGM